MTQTEIIKELLARRKARRDYLSFVEYIAIEDPPVKHHKLIIDKLQAVSEGQIRRLMLFLPPGHAKTTYATILFPTFYLGKHSDRSVISASYGQRLSSKFGKRCRNLVDSRKYKAIFGYGLAPGSAARDEWETAEGGEFTATSVDGAATGRRGDLLIADDIVKGRQESESEVSLDNIWDWWLSDFRTRLKPNGAIILIMTRWSEDDPAGRILPENYNGESGLITGRDLEQWCVVCLPALAEENDLIGRQPGEALWPEWFSKEILEQERITQGPRNWSALYQQRPSPEDGDYFKREWVRYYDEKPKHLRIYGASDYATSEGKGDYTVHGVCGVDPDDDLYILDWWREQTTTDVWIDTLVDLVIEHKPTEWAEEAGQIAKSVGPFLAKRLMEEKAYCYRQQYPSSRDKPTRAQSFRGRMAQGKVYFPRKAPWLEKLISELMAFPAGKNDDQVDVLSLFGRILERMWKASVPVDQSKNKGKFPHQMTLNEIIENHSRLMRQSEWD